MAGTLSVVFLATGIVLVVVVHVFVVLWALWWGFRAPPSRVGEHGAEEGGGGAAGALSAEEIGELPCHDFNDGGAGECAVCLEAFKGGDRCRVLPRCEHGFHAECVDSWLRKRSLCPICRAEVAARGKDKEAAGAVAEASTLEIVTER